MKRKIDVTKLCKLAFDPSIKCLGLWFFPKNHAFEKILIGTRNKIDATSYMSTSFCIKFWWKPISWSTLMKFGYKKLQPKHFDFFFISEKRLNRIWQLRWMTQYLSGFHLASIVASFQFLHIFPLLVMFTEPR